MRYGYTIEKCGDTGGGDRWEVGGCSRLGPSPEHMNSRIFSWAEVGVYMAAATCDKAVCGWEVGSISRKCSRRCLMRSTCLGGDIIKVIWLVILLTLSLSAISLT